MNKAGKIIGVSPGRVVPGGELIVDCENFTAASGEGSGCFIGEQRCDITAASSKRVIANLPDEIEDGADKIRLESAGDRSEPFTIVVGEKIVDEMHIVANPAVDPKDDSIIFTRSGSRGQQLPFTLYRLETDGYVDEFTASVMTPTSVAFDRRGDMFVTNRSEGEVYQVARGEEVTTYASGLGIASGLAFDANGIMYVGDRSGTIYRVPEFGVVEAFATLEPSVAAYHLAFAPDGRLFVSAPGLASHDAIFAIDAIGSVETYVRGFGRPQGIAFDVDGNLYAAACYRGQHGIVKVENSTKAISMYAAGNNLVGLCFTRDGDLIAASGDAAYRLRVGIKGFLLSE